MSIEQEFEIVRKVRDQTNAETDRRLLQAIGREVLSERTMKYFEDEYAATSAWSLNESQEIMARSKAEREEK